MSDLRQRILEAAETLLKGGHARITTRAIARVARCSDGALYRHFESLDALFVELFRGKVNALGGGLRDLPLQVGEGDVEGNLVKVLKTGLIFVRASMPMWLGLASDRRLRKAYYQRLSAVEGLRAGPHVPVEAITAYLKAEQRLGRVDRDAEVESTAAAVLACITQRAYFERVFEAPFGEPSDNKWAKKTAAALVRGCIRTH
jgi:AcrR family transcriptional regulator